MKKILKQNQPKELARAGRPLRIDQLLRLLSRPDFHDGKGKRRVVVIIISRSSADQPIKHDKDGH